MPRTRPRGYYLSPIRDAHSEIPQPIFIDAHGWTMPSAVAAGFKGPHRETGDEALATVMQRPRAKGLGGCGRGGVEKVLRHRRIGVALAAQEAADVAAVFAQQRARVIFRMALERNEQAPPALLRRCRRRPDGRPREDVIAVRNKRCARSSFQRECETRSARGATRHSGSAAAGAQSKTPKPLLGSRLRSMPSRCSTAAWAARHDQMVETVLSSAQSTSSVRPASRARPSDSAARGSVPVTISPSSALAQVGHVARNRLRIDARRARCAESRQREEPQAHQRCVPSPPQRAR